MRFRLWIFAFIALLAAGCAKFPAGGPGAFTKRLVFKMTVDGVLRTGLEPGGSGLPYVYVIAINLSTDDVPTTQGPIPIVVPSGNGIVAGNATHFVLWNPLTSPQYEIYQFRDSTLNEFFRIGFPINSTTTQIGSKTLEFEIDLSQLVPAADVNNYKSVQVNFLSMNNTNTAGGGRIWDALGNGNISTEINSPFTARLNTAQTYNNSNQGLIEPQNDAVDPDLDMVDWSIEVQIQ